MTSVIKHLFLCLIAIYVSSLSQRFCSNLLPFIFIQLLVFLFENSLCNLDTSYLCVCKYYFPVCSLFFFHSLKCAFKKFLVKSNNNFCLLWIIVLIQHLRNICLTQSHGDFLVCFLLCFIILGL